jgi:peptide/nickel transport system substrate-binding protein
MSLDGARRPSRPVAWAAAGVLAAVAALGLGTEPARPAQPVRVVVSNDRDIVNVDPIQISAPADYSVAYLVYSGLLRARPGTDQLDPDLAARWEVSSDGLTYTFHLRRGVKWQNGLGEVTADDVVAHFQRAANKASGSIYFPDFASVRRIDAPDRYTVRFVMDKPSLSLLTADLAYRPGLIVPKKIIDTNPDSLKTGPVGSGPYIFSSWRQGDEVILRANPDYYGGDPAVTEVDVRVVKNDQTALLALRRGEIDARYLQIPEVQRQALLAKDVRVLRAPMPRTYFFMFNLTRPPFNDVRVRQALWFGLNRLGILDTLFKGLGTFSDTMVPPTVTGSLPGVTYNYNVDRAKQLLKDAGADGGFPGKTFTLMALGLQDETDIAAVAQENWKDLGVNFNVQVVDTNVFLQRARAGNFDALNFAELRSEPEQFLGELFDSRSIGSFNFARYDGADSPINAMRTAATQADRIRYAQDVQRQLERDAPAIPVLNPTLMLVHTPRIAGVGLQLLIFNAWQWSVAP